MYLSIIIKILKKLTALIMLSSIVSDVIQDPSVLGIQVSRVEIYIIVLPFLLYSIPIYKTFLKYTHNYLFRKLMFLLLKTEKYFLFFYFRKKTYKSATKISDFYKK